jgi:hypothetical protein
LGLRADAKKGVPIKVEAGRRIAKYEIWLMCRSETDEPLQGEPSRKEPKSPIMYWRIDCWTTRYSIPKNGDS